MLHTTGIISALFSEAEHMPAMGMSYDTVLDELCHVGHPGEMFTSAAPQDPLFWPLHGLAERFVQLVRLYAAEGVIAYDETWGYDHVNVMSDTHRVCDWTNATGLELPTCAPGVCPGHREDDVLPFEYVFGAGGQQYYSNAEFYAEISPSNDEMPYVYDKLQTWPGCEGGTMSFGSATAAR